jgi:GNAT superfamily N-acetyltransferase
LISLRPVTDADRPFLVQLYGSTREQELALTDWNEEQKQAFVEMQFQAQDAYYREVYPSAEYLLILRDGAPIGRFYVNRRQDEIRIVDLAIISAERGRGVGSKLLHDLFLAAENTPVTIHVEQFNPARRLYERLGFRLKENKGVYLFMERRP